MLSSITGVQVLASATVTLKNLRDALQAAADLHEFTSGISATDLTDLPAADANAILSAIADANALSEIYDTGLPPSSYPQPASAYVYGASQRRLIGPQ